MNGFLLAFDFGIRNIGVAVGQKITNTARPLRAIKVQTYTFNWKKIECLLKEWQPYEVIIGLPLNMDGSEQPITFYAKEFAKEICHRFCITVKLYDERLSTVEARSNLFELGGFQLLKKKEKNIDSVSAVVILESYLFNLNNS